MIGFITYVIFLGAVAATPDPVLAEPIAIEVTVVEHTSATAFDCALDRASQAVALAREAAKVAADQAAAARVAAERHLHNAHELLAAALAAMQHGYAALADAKTAVAHAKEVLATIS